MSDKLALNIFHSHRTIPLTRPSTTLIQTVLEDACKLLKIADPTSVRLVIEKGEKALDHSHTLRLANIKTGAKLAIINAPASRSSLVTVTLQWKDQTFTHTFPLITPLFQILTHFESVPNSGLNWTTWHGIPEPEVNSMFEMHINVPGYMQPVIEIGTRKIAKNDELHAITLANLGIASDHATPAKLKLKLTHTYVAPKKTEAEQQAIMENFQRKYAEMTSSAAINAATSTPATASTTAAIPAQPLPLDEEEDIDITSSSDDESPSSRSFTLPSDRGLKLFYALPGLLKPPELSDEFYDITEEDSRAYAKGLRAEVQKALRESGGTGAVASVDKAEGGTIAGAVHPTGTLLDSHRLPPVPTAQERRNARIKRKCHASLIRIRLANHLYIEGLFRLQETPTQLYQWLDMILDERMKSQMDYYLYLTPPRQIMSRTSHLTLEQLGLFPQALIHLGMQQTREMVKGSGEMKVTPDTPEETAHKAEQAKIGVIKEEFWSKIQTMTPAATIPSSPLPTATITEEKKESSMTD